VQSADKGERVRKAVVLARLRGTCNGSTCFGRTPTTGSARSGDHPEHAVRKGRGAGGWPCSHEPRKEQNHLAIQPQEARREQKAPIVLQVLERGEDGLQMQVRRSAKTRPLFLDTDWQRKRAR